jgi:IS605 OrfB family transposase
LLSLTFYDRRAEEGTLARLRDPHNKLGTLDSLPPFFANLLPEGILYDIVESQLPFDERHAFGMIKCLGADLPRLLQRLSGREARFQRHTNHVISKQLVHRARQAGLALAVEDLTGIRQRTNQMPRSKQERRRSNSWAFFQLRQFLSYKALAAGVQWMLVNPAYTSQTCHCCCQIGERQGKWFECVDGCGWRGDADLNGARNIRILGLLVSQPEGSESSFAYACEWPRTKAHAIAKLGAG